MATYRGPATLTQISRAAQLPVPTVHRLVNRLVDLGYISHSPGHRFRIGPKFIPLGEAAVSSSLDAIGPLLRDLSDTVGETVSLVTLEQDRVVCVAYAESTRAVRVIVDPAMRPLPHSTAAGKVMLAQLDDDDVRALLKRTGLPASTTRTVTSADAAIAGVREVRADGYAIDVNELEVGLNCIAVPVRGIRCHALAVLGPSSRVTPDDRSRFVSYLDDAAAQIASLLDSWVPTAEPQGDGAATIPTSGGRTSPSSQG